MKKIEQNAITKRFIVAVKTLKKLHRIKSFKELAKDLSYTPQGISQILNGRVEVSAISLSKFLELHPEISPEWVLFGSGQFYKTVMQPLPQTNVNGSLPLDKSHICFENGHNMFLVTEIDNGRTKYGEHKCSRCGWVDSFQYDYGSW